MNPDRITTRNLARKRSTWIVLALLAALVAGACTSARSGSGDGTAGEAADETTSDLATFADEPDPGPVAALEAAETAEGSARADDLVVGAAATEGLRVIRDGRVDVRVEPGTFDQAATEVRVIAEDLGGYVSGGETHLETIDGKDHAVGWFTVRVPSARFEEAMARVDDLGERLNLEVSSQDVSEEYVDLESRLRSWRSQEAFYARLMEDATTVEDLVAIQTRMQDVLLNIEQIEGRIRYLDARTEYATITAGISEVPGTVPPIEPPAAPGIVASALEQAGAVLLGTVGFLIVAAAFLLPIVMVAVTVYVLFRAVQATRRRQTSS